MHQLAIRRFSRAGMLCRTCSTRRTGRRPVPWVRLLLLARCWTWSLTAHAPLACWQLLPLQTLLKRACGWALCAWTLLATGCRCIGAFGLRQHDSAAASGPLHSFVSVCSLDDAPHSTSTNPRFSTCPQYSAFWRCIAQEPGWRAFAIALLLHGAICAIFRLPTQRGLPARLLSAASRGSIRGRRRCACACAYCRRCCFRARAFHAHFRAARRAAHLISRFRPQAAFFRVAANLGRSPRACN